MAPAHVVAMQPPPLGVKAVLVGAESEIEAFDNATGRLFEDLTARIAPASLHVVRFSERRIPDTERSDLPRILQGIASMQAGPTDSCLIFVTGHGSPNRGVALPRSGNYLMPNALDRAIAHGCGERPTVVVISACFSGIFAASSVARDNRIVLTAARRDRPSFGCDAENDYTYFDGCFLSAFENKALTTWEEVAQSASVCVGKLERAQHFQPSEPQLFVGGAVAGLKLPGANP
jgi:hypothetical protein